MSTPVDEFAEPSYAYSSIQNDRASEEGTVVGEGTTHGDLTRDNSDQDKDRDNSHDDKPRDNSTNRHRFPSLQPVSTQDRRSDRLNLPPSARSQSREQSSRLEDELRMLQVERQVSRRIEDALSPLRETTSIRSNRRDRSRHEEPIDEFDAATNPLHERTQAYQPPEHPSNRFAKVFKRIHQSNVLVRYVLYITPLVFIILIPLLVGALVNQAETTSVGGVRLVWFCIWLEIVWLTLWASRIIAKALPWPIGLISSVVTNNSKKWRDMGKQLELPATLFFWWLAIEISFLPTMKNHHVNGNTDTRHWELVMNKVLISFFVAAILNFIEKIIIQLIAISFHTRTYQDRIESNKFEIGSLTKLYKFSREKIAMEDVDFEDPPARPGSGTMTPGQMMHAAQRETKQVMNKFGDVAGKIAGDFTGRERKQSNHPAQVILSLLASTSGSQVLARRLYRTFAREDTETILQDDLLDAFQDEGEADMAFTMFDKDLNGDISMGELESVCVEIGRERKSITASLKDLDSVVGKLDDCFLFIVVVIAILVFISLISTSAAGVLTSAGSAVLALSWLFSTTAQEFLQSCIFVFVKHPFDVGDRVTIYGNTGDMMKGDDYFVKEISLLYTEFKKMQGHVVQAPNSYLNTLFILNMRRSGAVAEPIPIVFKFGTTMEQITALREKMLDFVKEEKREFQPNILTEVRSINEAHSVSMNLVCFYKSSWQNELVRLQRRNKIMCTLMVAMHELGIEGPRMRYPGQKESFPLYTMPMAWSAEASGTHGHPDNPAGIRMQDPVTPMTVEPRDHSLARIGSTISHSTRNRGESLAAMGRRVDFSLGMDSMTQADVDMGDVYEDRGPKLAIPIQVTSPTSETNERDSRARHRSQSVAQSTGRDNHFDPGTLMHRGTEPVRRISNSSHRNRFFPRPSHESDRMEAGMAGIPEESRGGSRHNSFGRLDPRTGITNHIAVRSEPTPDSQDVEMRRL